MMEAESKKRRGRVRHHWAKWLALCVLLAAVLVPPAVADDNDPTQRLDPTLRRLVYSAAPAPQALTEPLTRDTQPADHVNVTIRAKRDLSPEVAGLRGHVNTVIQGEPAILTAHLPISSLRDLAQNPAVIAISATAPVSTALDESVADIRADQVWSLESQGLPITGQGALIGIVDTGIDFSHPDFKDSKGRSRIVDLWDQTGSGTPPIGFDYGVEWHRWQLEAGFATETDTEGHGTHMAGVAAGNGAHYRGVAPGAELIVVKSPLDTASIIDAWNYIVDKAADLGRPVVINNSFGGHTGAHDGTADYERALDALSGPGVIFVTAAGNEGQSAMHAAGRVSSNETASLPISFFPGYGRPFAEINVWYPGIDSLSVSLTAPTGQTFGPVAKGDLRIFSTRDGTEITVDAVSAPWPANGDNWIRIRLDGAGGDPIGGDWTLKLHGVHVFDGQFDAWLPYGPYDKVFFGYYIDWYKTVREPGTALQAISAGGYVTKDCWTANNGEGYCDSYTNGDLYPYTSRGPTRDGRPRPDVNAPGARVFAPRSADAPVQYAWQLAPDARYAGRIGTSISTAHVTGVVALMLQVDPALNPATVRNVLRLTARQDNFTRAGSDRQWGAGKLDALATVRAVRDERMNKFYLPLLLNTYHWQPAPTATATLIPTSTPAPTVTPLPTRTGPQPSPIAGEQ